MTSIKTQSAEDLQRDISMIDLVLRLSALEQLLIKTNIIKENEFNEELTKTFEKMNKIVKDAGLEDLSKLIKVQSEK